MDRLKILILALLIASPLTSFAVTPSTGSSWGAFNQEFGTGSNISNIYIIPFGVGHTCTSADISFAGSAVSIWGTNTVVNGTSFSYLQSIASTFLLPDPGAQGTSVYLCLLYSVTGSGSWNVDNATPFQYITGSGGGGNYSSSSPFFLASASSTFETLTGIDAGSVIDGLTNAGKFAIGSVLVFLDGLKYWVLAGMAIVVICGLILYAFKFFKTP